MENISHYEDRLRNEKIQIYLRIVLVSVIFITLYLFYKDSFKLIAFHSVTLKDLMLGVVFANIFYYFFILKYPHYLINIRIPIVSVLDVMASLYVMHLVGDYALYYPFLMLWYSIGYSMRYGTDVGYLVYFSVLIGWMILAYTTPVWGDNLPMTTGWFLAFMIIPLYAFRLVYELRENINHLHENLDNSIYQAEHDQLTHLANRKLFDRKLHHATQKYKQFALLFIDLDAFKEINDKYGHHIGDKVLVEVSKRLSIYKSFSARLGGDEFVFIVEYENKDELTLLASSLVSSISEKCPALDIKFSASIGIACYPHDADNLFDLKKRSDAAMYQAKQSGKNTFKFYSNN